MYHSGAVLAFNWRNTADVWFFHKFESVNVLWLLLITAAGSIVSFWIVSKVFGALRELRALRLERQKKRQLGEQRELAKKLEERERRIDEKLRRSIADESESS